MHPSGSSAVDPVLFAVLVVAGLGSSLILAAAVVAFARRGSRSYLLVALAIGTLVARTAVGAVGLFGPLADGHHHLLEHGLDAATVALLVAAVYFARDGDVMEDST